MLREKHPDTRTPDLSDPECKSFKDYSDPPEAVPLDMVTEDVERIASHLSGAEGPGGTDTMDLCN
eukprot:13384114-Ditylum_brightwellii.AAC.1